MDHVSVKPPTYHTLDAWRGVASLWVVAYHMSLVILVSYPALIALPLYRFAGFGSLGVQMFFVISGYCIANAGYKCLDRDQGFLPFMSARLRRIYPPMWFALTFAAALSALAALLVSTHHIKSSVMAEHGVLHQSLSYYISNLTLTQGLSRQPFLLAQCWTLCYEMAFYLLIGLMLVPSMVFRPRLPLLTMLHVLTSFVLILLILVPRWVGYPFDLWPQFGLGILVFDVLTHPARKAPKVWMMIVSTLVLVFVSAHSYLIGMFGESSQTSFLFCLLFAGVIVCLYKYEIKFQTILPVKLLMSVGVFSYSLYLTHTFIIGVVNQALKALHLHSSYHLAIFFVFMILSVGFARLFFHFFERPFMGRSKQTIRPALPRVASLESNENLRQY